MGKTIKTFDNEDYSEDEYISKSSKKIQKQPKTKKTASPKAQEDKKYKTVGDETKDEILSQIQSKLTALHNHQNPSEINKDLLQDLIKATKVDQYNKIIEKALEMNSIEVPRGKAEFTQMRKKIKNWINSSGKAETRGGVAVPEEIKEDFYAFVLQAVQGLQYRKFETLRSTILPCLEELRSNIGLTNTNKMCSKHWWFDYLNEYDDIKKIWEGLPRLRSANKTTKNGPEASEAAISIQTSPSHQAFQGSDCSSQFVYTEEKQEFVKQAEESSLNSNCSTGSGFEVNDMGGFNNDYEEQTFDNSNMPNNHYSAFQNEGYNADYEVNLFLQRTPNQEMNFDDILSSEEATLPSPQVAQIIEECPHLFEEECQISENSDSTRDCESPIQLLDSPISSYEKGTEKPFVPTFPQNYNLDVVYNNNPCAEVGNTSMQQELIIDSRRVFFNTNCTSAADIADNMISYQDSNLQYKSFIEA